jgi:hypothetical protein
MLGTSLVVTLDGSGGTARPSLSSTKMAIRRNTFSTKAS